MTERIPKRIIQIWAGGAELPLLYRAACANVRLLNPSFEYMLFDDQRMHDFMQQNFPEHIATLAAFKRPIQRYDFFRYLAVFKLGGFYFDTDLLLAKGIDDLCRHSCVVPFERLTWSTHLRDKLNMDWEIGNYAFGAEPGHPLIAALIENCARAQRDPDWCALPLVGLPQLLRRELDVIYSTGPGMFSRTLAEFKRTADSVTVLGGTGDRADRATWNQFGQYGVHLGGSSWRERHGGVRRRLINFLAQRNEARAIALARGSELSTLVRHAKT